MDQVDLDVLVGVFDEGKRQKDQPDHVIIRHVIHRARQGLGDELAQDDIERDVDHHQGRQGSRNIGDNPRHPAKSCNDCFHHYLFPVVKRANPLGHTPRKTGFLLLRKASMPSA